LVISLSLPFFSEAFKRLPENTRLLYLSLSLSPLVYSRALSFAHGTTPDRALFDAFGSGLGIISLMVIIAAIRETIGCGSLAGKTIWAQPPWPLAGSILGGIVLTAGALYLFNQFFKTASR
jgi:Na+-transporting NADH:ubiquinone oxidoreductase subunit NqrD